MQEFAAYIGLWMQLTVGIGSCSSIGALMEGDAQTHRLGPTVLKHGVMAMHVD